MTQKNNSSANLNYEPHLLITKNKNFHRTIRKKICAIGQFIWASANWYCSFDIIFTYHALHFLVCAFFSQFMYALIDRISKQTVLIKRFFFVFVKSQFNVQTASAEICFKFQNWEFFLWGLIWIRGSLNGVYFINEVHFFEKVTVVLSATLPKMCSLASIFQDFYLVIYQGFLTI